MKRRQAILAILASTLALVHSPLSRAQSGAKGPVIGLLDVGERLEWWNAFRQQMRELGYVEGRNVTFEARYAKGRIEALPALAKELVQLNVAVIVAGGGSAAVAAQRVTRKTPIVIASGAGQVSLGLAASLSRPGGNVTGLSSLNSDLMGKRVDLLREVVPKVSRLGALWHADNSPSSASVKDLEGSAARSRLGFQSFGIRSAEELTEAFAAMTRDRVDALVVVNSGLLYGERRNIADLASKHKLPAMYGTAEYVEAGGLLSYATSYPDLYRRAAIYVDRILKGANPGDMPIEQPTTFELVINAKAARALGLAIPPSILAGADPVIE